MVRILLQFPKGVFLPVLGVRSLTFLHLIGFIFGRDLHGLGGGLEGGSMDGKSFIGGLFPSLVYFWGKHFILFEVGDQLILPMIGNTQLYVVGLSYQLLKCSQLYALEDVM